VQLASSDPSQASVAPFAGRQRLFTPNPIAMGIPTSGAPILIDVSTSSTTNAMVARTRDAGAMMKHPWLLDAAGRPTDDPAVFFSTPAGSIMPLGGPDLGHKGFGLALMVEALTSALAGTGRKAQPTGWGASVFLLMLRTDAFGGRAAFEAETDFLTRKVKENRPVDRDNPPRVPGDRALQLKCRQLRDGIQLREHILASLRQVASTLDIPMPLPISDAG
jgi:L-lactate dehydrogenase